MDCIVLANMSFVHFGVHPSPHFPPHQAGPVFFFRCGFFLEVFLFFWLKKIIRSTKNYLPKKLSALKKGTQTFLFCAEYCFLAQMLQILEVVKKVSWAVPWAFLGGRGV